MFSEDPALYRWQCWASTHRDPNAKDPTFVEDPRFRADAKVGWITLALAIEKCRGYGAVPSGGLKHARGILFCLVQERRSVNLARRYVVPTSGWKQTGRRFLDPHKPNPYWFALILFCPVRTERQAWSWSCGEQVHRRRVREQGHPFRERGRFVSGRCQQTCGPQRRRGPAP